MANTIKSNGSVTVATPTVSIKQLVYIDYTATGSNVVYEAKNIPSGSWTALATQSLYDMRFGMFSNNTTGATIAICTSGSGGTAQVLTSLAVDETAVIPFSSSIGNGSLFARSYLSSSISNAVLEYTLVES